jgi:pyridinium-3,5-biscarboxylic acid mononucleotide sulfurtransferase
MENKLERLRSSLKTMGSVFVALSGGVDSSFLTSIAHEVLNGHAVAITITSPMHSKWELQQAKQVARSIGLDHIIIELDINELEEVIKNDENRCYHCKKLIFEKIKNVAETYQINYVLDGSNIDDQHDFRPGTKALEELGIISPLKDVGLTKQEIRTLSKQYGIKTSDLPSFACLATRFPYHIKISEEKLRQIERCEEVLRTLGIDQFRVRYHQDIARIEVESKDFLAIIDNREHILKTFKEQGFHYITLDLKGYRTGSLNEELDL